MNPLLLLGAAAIFLATQSSGKPVKKASSVKNTYKGFNQEDIKRNNENILKYYAPVAQYIGEIEPIYSVLTPNLLNFVKNEELFVMIPTEKANELYQFAEITLNQKYKTQKGIYDDSKIVDDITQELLTLLAADVYWKERLVPYQFGSPFQVVWSGTNEIVKLAAKNLEEKGIIGKQNA